MKISFISGHGDLSPEEFDKHYKLEIDKAISDGCSFVVGDFRGADTFAQIYLYQYTQKVTVYHMFDTPRCNPGYLACGGFTSDDERDAAMTKNSDYDIAWVRPGKEKSGTAKNIQRRKTAIKS